MKEFWMVYIEGLHGPTKQHFELNEARLEAERLLNLPANVGRKAFILKSTMYGYKETPVTWSTFPADLETSATEDK